MSRRNAGLKAEQKVSADLRRNGHLILATNLYIGSKEIDIISYYNKTLYIFEVRSSKTRFSELEIIFPQKKVQNIISAVQNNRYIINSKIYMVHITTTNHNLYKIKYYPIQLFL